jgi:transposase
MEKDIDFMADVDDNTPPELVLKMLHAARRGFLKQLEVNALLQIKLFGKSSEKRAKKQDPQIFDEAKATPKDLIDDGPIVVQTDDLDTALGAVSPGIKTSKARGRKPIPQGLPRHDIIHDFPDDQKRCICGCALQKIGEDISEKLALIPAQIYVERHVRLKYACKQCQEHVKQAPVQNQAIPKILGAPGLLAHVAVMKFDDHLPLYRQSEIWSRLGVDLSRATLSSWILKMGTALAPLVTCLQKHIIQSSYVQADETVAQVLQTPNKSDQSNSYMWVYKTGNDPKPAVVYDYQQSRKGMCAQTFLEGFNGVLQTDGYSGYKCITDQDHVMAQGCFAHARRKFHDVWMVAKKEGIASKALDVIAKLYDIEHHIKDLSSGDKQKIRKEKAIPILDAFQGWVVDMKPHVQEKGSLDKAIAYTLNQWDALTYYVQNGDVAIDNNAAERQIKPFAVGRKNWLFMGSPEGAKAAAILYSLIETAKLNDVNPEGYLKAVLEHKIDETNQSLIESLMPWTIKIHEAYPKPSLQPKDQGEGQDQPNINVQKNTT